MEIHSGLYTVRVLNENVELDNEQHKYLGVEHMEVRATVLMMIMVDGTLHGVNIKPGWFFYSEPEMVESAFEVGDKVSYEWLMNLDNSREEGLIAAMDWDPEEEAVIYMVEPIKTGEPVSRLEKDLVLVSRANKMKDAAS